MSGVRSETLREPLGDFVIEEDHRRREYRDPVPLQPATRITQSEMASQCSSSLEESAFERRDVQSRFEAIIGRASAKVGQHENSLVAGDLRGSQRKTIDVVGRLQPLEVERPKAIEVDSGGGFRVQPV